MNILIVDDLKFVVESLKNGISWEKIGISDVFTAGSVAEAKLLITNFDIDIMLTDIEMPGENGLELVRWVKEKNYDICSIFLTSHADFAYIQTALRLGGFDYIMQPVRYQEVEDVVLRAICEVKKNKKLGHMEQAWNQLLNQKSIFLDAILRQLRIHDYYAAEVILGQLLSALEIEKNRVILYGVHATSDGFKITSQQKSEDFIEKFLRVIENSFDKNEVRVFVSHSYEEGIYLLMIADKVLYDEAGLKESLKVFRKNIIDIFHTDCVLFVSIGIECINQDGMRNLADTFIAPHNMHEKEYCQIVWDVKAEVQQNVEYKNNVLTKAIDYIQTHIGENITRTEVAACVCLSEEYFSKLFKQCLGCSFKEYVIEEKMKVARSLLANSELPVSLIAAKLGFVNFSHFSKTFKKNTGLTPQEYRKIYQKKG